MLDGHEKHDREAKSSSGGQVEHNLVGDCVKKGEQVERKE